VKIVPVLFSQLDVLVISIINMMIKSNPSTPPPIASPMYRGLEVNEVVVEPLTDGLVVNPSVTSLVVASGRKVGKMAGQLMVYPVLDTELAVLPAHHAFKTPVV
jgi:hypothetical protein